MCTRELLMSVPLNRGLFDHDNSRREGSVLYVPVSDIKDEWKNLIVEQADLIYKRTLKDESIMQFYPLGLKPTAIQFDMPSDLHAIIQDGIARVYPSRSRPEIELRAFQAEPTDLDRYAEKDMNLVYTGGTVILIPCKHVVYLEKVLQESTFIISERERIKRRLHYPSRFPQTSIESGFLAGKTLSVTN